MNLRALLRTIPRRAVVLPLGALLWNQLIYQGAFLLCANRTHYDLSLPLDHMIPLVPWTVAIYFGCFAFWAVHYVMIAWQGKETMVRFFAADFWSKAVCFVIFLLFPTMIVRPEVTGTGFWNFVMKFLYRIDQPYNLFPSIHCLLAVLCWLSVRKDEKIPTWYRTLALLFAVAVCISTLTTRQHVLADVFGGTLLAVGSWWATKRFPLTRTKRLFDRI